MSKNRDFSKLGNYITADANGNLTITGVSAGYGTILSSIDGGSGVSYLNYVNAFQAQNTTTNSSAVTGLAFNLGVSGDVLGFEISSNGVRTSSSSAVTKAYSNRSSLHIYNTNNSGASQYSDFIIGSAAQGSTSVTALLKLNGINGNLGLAGATQQAWSKTQFNAIEIGAGYSYFTGRVDLLNGLWLGTNAYYNGTNWKYVNSSYATQYKTYDGAHYWDSATSGTAGNNITWNTYMTISNSGAFTFGSITPTASTLITTKAFGSTSATYSLHMYKSDGTTDLMFLRDDGVLAVNGTAGGYLFYDRSNTGNYSVWYNTSGLVRLYTNVGNSDVATINTTSGAYIAVSDINKKKDFEPYLGSAITAIKGLEPTLYRMKGEDESVDKSLWFIAQQVKSFIPEAYVETVSTDENGKETTFIGINDKAIIAVMVKAIQEQQAQIDELKAIINGQN